MRPDGIPHVRRGRLDHARWSDLGLTGPAAVRDARTAADLRGFGADDTTTLPAGQAVMLTVASAATAIRTPTRALGAGKRFRSLRDRP